LASAGRLLIVEHPDQTMGRIREFLSSKPQSDFSGLHGLICRLRRQVARRATSRW
jgi:hypothetical protein